MYVKLYADILQSSVWAEDPATVKVWITLLLLSDEEGLVRATAPGLALTAGLPRETVEAALEKFLSPDVNSRTPDNKGRRIKRVSGGYLILNYKAYRQLQSQEARRKTWRESQQKRRRCQHPVNTCQQVSTPCHAKSTEEEEEEEVEVEAITHLPLTSLSHSVTDAENDNGGEIDFQEGETATATTVPQPPAPASAQPRPAEPLPLHPGWDEHLLASMRASPEGRKIGLDKAGEFTTGAMLVHPPRIVFATVIDIARANMPARKPLSVLKHRLHKISKGERQFMPSDEHLDEAVKRLAKREREP